MGAEPWFYFVLYQDDIEAALNALKEREFAAGRFNGAEMQPESMEDALEVAGADGTRSILDMMGVSDTPEFFAVTPVPPAQLLTYFGTEKPTRVMVERNHDYFEDIERGHGICLVVYKDDQPHELYFAGYSFD
jgi:hypothetical protein